MASCKQMKIRKMRRTICYPYLIAADESDYNEGIIENRIFGYDQYGTESSTSICSRDSNFQPDSRSQLDQYNCGPKEHLLSDNNSVDVLILEKEMKTVLIDLEKLGILEDDYRSLALTTEEEKVDDSERTWPPPSYRSEESNVEGIIYSGILTERENDWELLSSADSVWTVDTFGEEGSVRGVLLESIPLGFSGPVAQFCGEPRIHTVPAELIPPHHYQPTLPPPTQTQTNKVVNLEMLEKPDMWNAIRESIRSGFGSSESLSKVQ